MMRIIAVVLFGSSVAMAAQEPARLTEFKALLTEYKHCVGNATVALRGKVPDKNLLIEQAFAACATEEAALAAVTVFLTGNPQFANMVLQTQKLRLKRELRSWMP
jgi:hypothetical protein